MQWACNDGLFDAPEEWDVGRKIKRGRKKQESKWFVCGWRTNPTPYIFILINLPSVELSHLWHKTSHFNRLCLFPIRAQGLSCLLLNWQVRREIELSIGLLTYSGNDWLRKKTGKSSSMYSLLWNPFISWQTHPLSFFSIQWAIYWACLWWILHSKLWLTPVPHTYNL